MEPMLPSPAPNPESSPQMSGSSAGIEANSTDKAPETRESEPTKLSATAQPQSQAQPQVQSTDDSTVVSSTTDDNGSASPAVADDVDVIEKEWVDKAKKIVDSTKDNPRAQEKEVSKLQAEYLMKRYGKQLKVTE